METEIEAKNVDEPGASSQREQRLVPGSAGVQEPEQQQCGTSHYAGCACHEKGWQNKWQYAVEMAARATVERDEARRMWCIYQDKCAELNERIAHYKTTAGADRAGCAPMTGPVFLVDCDPYNGELREYSTITGALAENRILKITVEQDGRFLLREMGDEYFVARLTREQLIAWSEELRALADTQNVPVDLPDTAAQDSASKSKSPAVSG